MLDQCAHETEISSSQLQPASSAEPPDASPGHAWPLEKFSESGTVSPSIAAWDARGFPPVSHVFDALSPATWWADSWVAHAESIVTAATAISTEREPAAASNTFVTAPDGSSPARAASICAFVAALSDLAERLDTSLSHASVRSTSYASGANPIES